MKGALRKPGIHIDSAKVKVPGRRRSEVFRQFCEISGDRSGRQNKAKLKLSVIGRKTVLRKTGIRISDRCKGKAEVRVMFPRGWGDSTLHEEEKEGPSFSSTFLLRSGGELY